MRMPWEQFLNNRLRAKLRLAFAEEARADAAAFDQRTLDRIWRRTYARLPEPPPAPRRHSWWLLPLAGVPALAAVCALWPLGARPLAPNSLGLKGSGEVWPQVTSLRFATVGTNRELTPGADGMTIMVGTPVIFAIESQGASSERPLAITLLVRKQSADGRAEPPLLIGHYSLTQAKTTLREGGEAMAFTPDAAGLYQFYVHAEPHLSEADADSSSAWEAANLPTGGRRDAGFTLRVLAR